MKKTMLFAGILAASSLFVTSCSKDDTEAPLITLIGDNPHEIDMFDTYTDPGATAEDNEDGNLSSSITVDASDVDNTMPGHYEVYYSVSDAAGNTGTATREVHVHATAAAMADTYNVFDTCGTGAAAQAFSYTQTVTAVNATTMGFNKFADYSGNTGITTTIDEEGVITLASQPALDIGSSLDDHTFSGTGSVTANGFKLSYNDQNITTSSIAQCRAWFVRQ
ncbi:MAG: DUF5011 domain-containing protein [Bacteroidia bacterium]